MLTRFQQIMIGLLAVQVGLAVYTTTRDDRAQPVKERPLLAGYDAADVTRLQVLGNGAGDKPVDLVKKDGGWVIASAYGYPADASKVNEALGALGRMQAAAPIATKAGRHRQLHVDDADFERKLIVSVAGKDTTVYVGGAAGPRRTAVRTSGDAVYAVSGLSAYSYGTDARSWLEPHVVKLSRDEVAKITIEGGGTKVELERGATPPAPAPAPGADDQPPPPPPAPTWTVKLDGAAPALTGGETIDADKVAAMVDHATMIPVSEPADPARAITAPTATITIERTAATGATSTPAPIVLDVVADGDRYWLHERGAGKAALVDKVALDDVVHATRDAIVKKPEKPAPPQPTGTTAPGGDEPLSLPPMPPE